MSTRISRATHLPRNRIHARLRLLQLRWNAMHRVAQ